MRIVYNILIALMLAGIVAAGAWRAQTDRDWNQRVAQARSELQRLQREISLRTALRDVPVSERGYPLLVNPLWFEGGLPVNTLLDEPRPWVEIANDAQTELRHPPDPIAHFPAQAMFWYNPHTGRVRARVPAQLSEKASIELYNRVNGATLTTIER